MAWGSSFESKVMLAYPYSEFSVYTKACILIEPDRES